MNAAIILLLLLPVSQESLPLADSQSPLRIPVTLHVWAGLSVLPVVAARLALRHMRGLPPPKAMKPHILFGTGRLAHLLIYACMIILTVSGGCYWHFALHGAHLVHEITRVLLTFLIGLHVMGALGQHFLFRTPVLTRIFRSEQ
jgi:cytochrome b561